MRETDEYLIERYRFKFQRQLYQLSEKLSDKTLLWYVFALLPSLFPVIFAVLFGLSGYGIAVYAGGFIGIVLMILMTEPIMEARKWKEQTKEKQAVYQYS